jgi:hypothetical protein
MVKHTRPKKTTFLVVLLIGAYALVGCFDQQDRSKALTVADRVHAHLRSAEFAAIYDEAAPRFKTVGSQSEFVSRMREFHEQLGTLKNVSEISYEVGMDSTLGSTYTLLFVLEYERGKVSEHLILVRPSADEMKLWKMDLQSINSSSPTP